jgi:hypothetical protein
MIPATPAFLAVVLIGCLTVADWAGRLRPVVLGLLVAGLLGLELRSDDAHRNAVRGIGVDDVVRVVERAPQGAILFGSTGTSGAVFSSFDYGHPANILDHLVALRVRSVQLVDDDSCARALPFLRGPDVRRYGIWLFYAASLAEARAAAHAFRGVARTVVAQLPDGYFVVRTDARLTPRRLIETGKSLRRGWKRAVPANHRVDELLIADRQLLHAPSRCVSYGDLGDPDISPHWPPAKTQHQ